MSCPRAEPSSQTSSGSKSEPSQPLADAVRIDVVVLAAVRDPDGLHLETLRIAVAIAADRHRRADRDHAGLQARVLRACGGRQRDIPDLALGVDDLHRAVRTCEVDVRLQLAGDLALLLLLAGPPVVGGSLNPKESQCRAGQSNQPTYAHDCLLNVSSQGW